MKFKGTILMISLFFSVFIMALVADPILDSINNHDAGWIGNTPPLITYCPTVCGSLDPPMYAEHEVDDNAVVVNVCRVKRTVNDVVTWHYGNNVSANPNACVTQVGSFGVYHCLCVDYTEDQD